MKKNIVVLVSEIANDYSYAVLDGINSFFKDKDVNLITITTKWIQNLLTKQYWIGMKLAGTEQIDGVIVLSSVYLSFISKEELTGFLSNLKTKNLVSISTHLDIKKSCSTYVSCDSAYDEIIKHLKNKHGCKRFAFSSAFETGSEEAKDRYNSFLKAMENNGLEFDKNLIFEGDFVYDKAYYAIKNRYSKKEDINFDALIASNDMMAFASIAALESIGVKVPDDVKVVGFDDIIQSQVADLSLSTISQQMELQGSTAAEIVWKRAKGQKVEERTPISIKPIFRQSCGCENKESEFLDKIRKRTFVNHNVSVSLHVEKNLIQQNIYFLLEAIQNEVTMDKLFETFDEIMPRQYVPSIAVCMYDNPIVVQDNVQMELPQKATVKLYVDKLQNIKMPNLKDVFNPQKMLLPSKYFGTEPGSFIWQPIFFSNKQYGYFVAKCITNEYLLSMIYLKTFSNVIAQSYIYTKQLEENEKLSSENKILQMDNTELNEISMIDSLTGSFNRRGFEEMGKEAIKLSIKMGAGGLIFFADMNDLKKINDNYGHEMGDTAIKLEAQIFKTVFRQNDVIGRLGGDEFAGVIPGLPLEHLKKTKEALKQACKSVSKENNLPFEISISFGAVEYSPDNCNLQQLLKLADKEQYKEKHKYHATHH